MNAVKPIRGHEGRYTVSDCGEIVSLNYAKTGAAKPLTPGRASSGYLSVALRSGAGKSRTHNVHRIVAETFILNPHHYSMVNHVNGDKLDNRVGNLEWCTAQQNTSHAVQMGVLNNRGERSCWAKLTELRVRQLRLARAGGATVAEIAASLGVSKWAVNNVLEGKSWRHV